MAQVNKALRIVRPNNSDVRNMSYLTRREITKQKPEKSLIIPLQKHAGRDASGQISIRHRGGGAKRMYRIVDFSLLKHINVPAKVLALEYDPNRSANIALIELASGKKIYTLAPKDLAVGTTIQASQSGPATIGNRLPLSAIPTGVAIHNLELMPGRGGQIVRSAGASAVVLSKEGEYAQVRLPSGEVRLVHITCFATIGTVSNDTHNTVRYAKAGRIRHMGRRPQVRGKAMNPKDHPHGGGEGHNSIGLKHPKTPTGKPALGYRTRKNKKTQPFIVRRRAAKR